MKKLIIAFLLATCTHLFYAQVTHLERGQRLETIVSQSEYCIVKAYLQHCKPCKDMAPLFDDFSELYADTITCIEMNCRDFMTTCSDLTIHHVPTLLFYKDGELINRHVGPCTLVELEQMAIDVFCL